ncbi:MAG: hypothetical protein VYC19_10640 [Pseudomonadota bacterium]|nr:hypothetical protein [Pseudomonadota bacterium]MEE3323452.1 hypothetical protein [Pseudomonadota bacterium]
MYRFLSLKCLMVAVVLTAWPSAADAMRVTPPRLVAQADQKVVHLYVKNDSKKTKAYRFRWKGVAMTKDGAVVNLDKKDASLVPEYRSAEPYLRFSPRRAVLKAGDTQRVTVLVRRAPDMVDGEYRIHLVVEPEPDAPDFNADEIAVEETAVGVDVLMARAVPVYILNGATDASLSIANAQLKHNPESRNKYYVEVDFEKQGNRSVLGLINVTCGGKSVVYAEKLFAVYAEADRRKEQVFLDEGLFSGCSGPLQAVVTGHADDQKAGQVLATAAVRR